MFTNSVPPNAARSFVSASEAVKIKPVSLDLQVNFPSSTQNFIKGIFSNELGVSITNLNFKKSLIKYDENYISTVAEGTNFLNELKKIILSISPTINSIHEIGCGGGN